MTKSELRIGQVIIAGRAPRQKNDFLTEGVVISERFIRKTMEHPDGIVLRYVSLKSQTLIYQENELIPYLPGEKAAETSARFDEMNRKGDEAT